MNRREFLALMATLPVVRLVAPLRLACSHTWKGFGRSAKIPGGQQMIFGEQCESCGHIKIRKQGRVRWGGFAEAPDSYDWDDVEL